MTNNNGFADVLNDLNTLVRVNNTVEKEVLEEAANYFVEKLKTRIKMSNKNKQTHLRDSLKIVVESDMVTVAFEESAWYWYLADKGHKKAGGKGRVPGLHFVQNTIDAEGEKIADMMASEIINRMEG